MNKTNQKIILTVLSVVLLTLLGSSFSVVEGLEIGYPEIGGEAPTEETKLPEYIKYIFNFSVIIAGLLAFAVIIFGGIVYLVSAGDPTKISDAKSRMFGGIVGLVLLLMTYLILTTINPELAILKEMKELKPVDGVYLCENMADCDVNDPNKKRHFSSDATLALEDFDVRWIKFIDDTDELISVFVYDDEGFEGNIEEIPNTGAEAVEPLPLTKSIRFLWNRPGVYLYEETDFELNSRRPLYLSGSTVSLGGDWNKKAQSVILKHPSEQICKGAVFFTDPGYEGRCGDISVCWPPLWPAADLTTSVDNLSVGDGSTLFSSIGNNEISSVHLYTVDTTKEYPGNITFYDEIDCKGDNELVKEPALGALMGDFIDDDYPGGETWDNRVLSFRINGEYKVILRTQELPPTSSPSNAQPELKCQGHWEIDETGCVSTVKGTTIYDPDPNNDEERPSSFQIIPAE